MRELRISAWAIKSPTPVALLFVALLVAGAISYLFLPVKQFPNISFPTVVVSVTQNGAAPAEMETQVTRPVEDAIAGIANIQSLTSSVTLGASITTVQFEIGEDVQKVTDEVRTRIAGIRQELPREIDEPIVQRLEIDQAPIITFAVSSDRMSPEDLSWFVDDTVARTLQGQKGVAQVGRVGGVDREINVTLDPARMRAFGVTALRMCLTLETPAMAFSTGRVICVSICDGAAPFCVTVTATTGKAMLGNCLIGSWP